MGSEVDYFVDLLQRYPSKGLVSNPWRDWDRDFDTGKDAPRHRSNHLRAYLNARLSTAKALLIAEAPSFQGAKFSGIPMTCERILLGHRKVSRVDIFDETAERHRTSRPPETSSEAVRLGGFCEPTAGYVWGHMASRPGLSKKIVLWNVFAFHPHKDTGTMSNRTPRKDEIVDNRTVLDAFLRLFPDLPILSIGETSKKYLTEWVPRRRLSFARHPAYGGGGKFRDDFDKFLKTL